MPKKIERTTEGLRDMLLNEMEDYINGINTKERLDTITKTTTAICKTLVIDIEAKKMLQRMNVGNESGDQKTIADLNLNMTIGNKSKPK